MHRFLKVCEVVSLLHVDERFLRALDTDDVIHLKESSEGEPVMSADDVDRVRMILTLTHELDINLEGAEVILHMRESMLAMRRQFEEILDALVEEMRRHVQR